MSKSKYDNSQSKIQNLKSKIESAVIQFENVSLAIGNGKTIVGGLTFEINRGETLVFLGRSGSGKTTTLKLINRLIEPTAGLIRVEDKPTFEWDAIKLRRKIGYVIQETGLFPHFTIERNIAVVPRLEGWPEAKTRERVEKLLEMVGLDYKEFARRYPHELSGGQRQRVGVARALAADPPIILMDEPFGALDPLTRAEMQREFRELAARLKKTIVFVTHDVREAFAIATRIGLFKDGQLVELAAPEEFARSESAEAKAFIETMND
jgi:osmoprotectant transport system ATP-binding protein